MLVPLLAVLAATPSPPLSFSGLESRTRVPLPRLEDDVTVDGHLDESVWSRAVRLGGFSQYAPVDGRPAQNETEVLVWYSPTAIHFGIRARAEPGSVRATLAQRDHIDGDDNVQIFLSTYNDGRQAWVFGVNPLGVQADGALVEGTRRGGGGFEGLETGREATDLAPDFVFDSKGRLTEDGYEVELRIPFKTLRYQPAPRQDWGLHVVRKVQASGHEESWVPARRAATSFLAQAGTLEGLEGLRAGLVLDVNPIVTARVDGAPASEGWSYDAATPELGGNVRWGVTPNLTLNGTVNPDFSQVESDAGQFQYDPRSAVFFEEKRPFFLDNIEQFATPNQLIYTRRVVAPVAAAKLTGKVSGTTLATLLAVDDRTTSHTGDAHPFFGILRVQRDLGSESKAAFVYTDRIDGDDYNRVAAADTRLAFGGVYTLRLQGALSWTQRAGRSVRAPLWEGRFERNGRRFGFRYLITGIDEEFVTESGFIARPGIVRANVDHRLTFFGAQGGLVESWSSDVVLEGVWRYRDFVDGRGAQDEKLHFNNNVTLRGGWKAGASLLVETFGYDEDLYADYALVSPDPNGPELLPFTGTPTLDNLDYVVSLETPRLSTFSGYVSWLWGKDENFFEWSPADIVYLTLKGEWRPSERIRVDAQYQLQQFKRRSDGSLVGRRRIPRVKLEYQVSRSVFLRLVGEYDAAFRDALRDDSRSELPIVIRDPDTGDYEPTLVQERNRFRWDALFSWQPTPGTVFFAGYGSTLSEPNGLRFHELSRTSDGFFIKFSYLFRM
jgi:hypothetical protein